MKMLLARFALFGSLTVGILLVALPVAAMERPGSEFDFHSPFTPGEETQTTDSGTEIEPVAIWTFAVIMMLGAVGGVLYLLKKRMGGFPAAAWKAPITIMPSKDFADETTWPDGATGDAGHGGHH